MVIMLVILTISIFIFIDLVRMPKKKEAPVLRSRELHIPSPPKIIERYFHPGHCWVSIDRPNVCTIGVDDFSQSVIGRIDVVDLPLEGMNINQGEPFVHLKHHEKSLAQVAPLSGKIEEVNPHLWDHPTRINDSPYEKGWLVKIRPSNLERELNNLLRGTIADRWKEAVRTQFLTWFSPNLGTVFQDGGTFIDNVSDLLTDYEWERLTIEFFPIVHQPKNIISNL